jgi:hypothetical protein
MARKIRRRADGFRPLVTESRSVLRSAFFQYRLIRKVRAKQRNRPSGLDAFVNACPPTDETDEVLTDAPDGSLLECQNRVHRQNGQEL